jgi:hypothetical protein
VGGIGARGRVVRMGTVTPKIVYFREQTAEKLIQGINAVANVVKVSSRSPEACWLNRLECAEEPIELSNQATGRPVIRSCHLPY